MEPDIDKIEAYLSGGMTGSERQAFEAELAADPALAEEVDLMRLAGEAVELSISDSLRTQMQEWREAEQRSARKDEAKVVTLKPRNKLRRLMAIAAGVLLLLAAGGFWYANDQYGAGKLAMAYYEDLSNYRDIQSSGDPLNEAVQNIRSGAYGAADEYLQNVPPSDPRYADARYLLGHSLYQQGQSAEAINVLGELENTQNLNLKEKAEWLIVLSYLQDQEADDADVRELLDKMVADPDHSYHQKAVELDRKLKSFWYGVAN